MKEFSIAVELRVSKHYRVFATDEDAAEKMYKGGQADLVLTEEREESVTIQVENDDA